MKFQATATLLATCLAFSTPVFADEEEEGFFSRSWRGVKSVFGVEASAEAQAKKGKKQGEERDYDDDDDDDDYDYDDDGKAKDKYKDRAKKEKDKRDKGMKAEAKADVRTQGRFSQEEIAAIRNVLGADAAAAAGAHADYDDDDEGKGKGKGKKPKKLPKGLQMKLERGGELPPGWQQKFQRGEVVDAEVYAQARAISPATLGGLATIPGTEVIQVGDRVARVLTSTREILDVINVVTGAPPQ